ncbi:hypothetical protein ACB092_04G158600 [Castanea dentata]
MQRTWTISEHISQFHGSMAGGGVARLLSIAPKRPASFQNKC